MKIDELEKIRDKKNLLESMVKNLEKRILTDEMKYKEDVDRLQFDLKDNKNKHER